MPASSFRASSEPAKAASLHFFRKLPPVSTQHAEDSLLDCTARSQDSFAASIVPSLFITAISAGREFKMARRRASRSRSSVSACLYSVQSATMPTYPVTSPVSEWIGPPTVRIQRVSPAGVRRRNSRRLPFQIGFSHPSNLRSSGCRAFFQPFPKLSAEVSPDISDHLGLL